MAYKPTDYNYREWTKAIRPYTRGFGASDGYDLRQVHKWSRYKKQKVREYYQLIKGLSAKSTYIYRPRNKQNLQAIKKATGTEQYPRLKVGIIQVPTEYDIKSEKPIPVKPEIKISKKGRVSIAVKGTVRDIITIEDIGYSPLDVAYDPEQFIDDFLNKYGDSYSRFTILAGEYEAGKGEGVPVFHLIKKLRHEFFKLLEKYDADKDGCNPNDSSGHFYGNWFRGFVGYRFSNGREFSHYAEALQAQADINKKNIEEIKKIKAKISDWRSDIRKTYRNKKITNKESQKRVDKFLEKINNAEREIKNIILRRFKHN